MNASAQSFMAQLNIQSVGALSVEEKQFLDRMFRYHVDGTDFYYSHQYFPIRKVVEKENIKMLPSRKRSNSNTVIVFEKDASFNDVDLDEIIAANANVVVNEDSEVWFVKRARHMKKKKAEPPVVEVDEEVIPIVEEPKVEVVEVLSIAEVVDVLESIDKKLETVVDRQLTADDVKIFFETVRMIEEVTPALKESRFLHSQLCNNVFCGLNACQKCLSVPSPDVSTISLDDISNDEWIEDLTEEGVEPNPGPINHDECCPTVMQGWPGYEMSRLVWNTFDRQKWIVVCDFRPLPENVYFNRFLISHFKVCKECHARIFCLVGYVSHEDSAASYILSNMNTVESFLKEFDLEELKYAVHLEHDWDLRDGIEEAWIRDLTCEGVESNPGPEQLNGNTKRNSKSHKQIVKSDVRLQRLASRDDKIGIDNKFKVNKLVTDRRQRAAEKCIMNKLFPKKENFKFELNILKEVKSIIDSLPEEMKKIVEWADIIAAIRVLISDEKWEAKYLALRVLYRECKVSNVSVEKLLISLVSVLSLCSVRTIDIPIKQNISHDFDPIVSFVVILLTFLFGRKPKQNRVDFMLEGLSHIPRRALGLNHLVEVAKVVFRKMKGIASPTESLEKQMDHIGSKVNFWLTKDGDKFVMQDPRGFDEVSRAVLEANELQKSLHSPTLKHLFSPTLFELRKIHQRVLHAPVSGHSYRKEPVVLHLVGKPGVGKTMMITAIAADALKKIFDLQEVPEEEQKKNLENHFQFIYWRPQGHKYETNYNTSFSKIYVVDDANQIDPDYTVDDLPFPARLIHMNNNADLLLPVAEIENKQTAKFNSDMIIATDNEQVPDLSYLQNSDAYFRRIDIEAFVSIDDKYTKYVNDVPVFDSNKIRLDKFDTSAYRFTMDNGKVLKYDDFIKLVCNKLEEKHIEFTRNRKNLSNYATRHWIKQEESVGESSNIPNRENSTLVNDVIEENSESWEVPYVSLAWTFFGTIGAFLLSRSFDFKSMWRRIIFLLFLQTLRSKATWDKLFDKASTKVRKRLFYIASVGTLLLSSYALYSWYSKRKCKSTENYSNGSVTKTVTKPKNKPQGALKVVRREGSGESEGVAIVENCAATFANAPNTESVMDPVNESLCKTLTSSTYQITISHVESGFWSQLSGTFIAGRIFMCNAHILDHLTVPFEQCLVSLSGLRNTYKDLRGETIHVWQLNHENDEGNSPYDVIFFEFDRTVTDHVNISNHFIPKSKLNSIKGSSLVVFSILKYDKIPAWHVCRQFSKVRDVSDDWMLSEDSSKSVTATYGSVEYDAQTQNGSCGSILVLNNVSFPEKIIGIHMASYPFSDVCFGTLVYREMIDCILQVAKKENIFGYPSNSVKLNLENKVTVIDDDLEHVTCVPHTVYSQTHTKIKKSILHGKVVECVKEPAHLGYVTINGVTDHVVNKAIKKYIGPSIQVDPRVCNIFQSFLRSKFRPTRVLKEFDLDIAIRGIEGNEYIQAINRASSPGYPFVVKGNRPKNKPGKTAFLGSEEEFIYDHPLLLSEIKAYKNYVEEGVRPFCYFISTAKDELRSKERVSQGKTRSFAAAPLHFVVLFRQKFLDISANIMETRIENGSLVGIDPYSREWDLLCRRLTRLAHPASKQFLAGDFSNFDGTLNRSFLWEIFDFLESSYKRENDPLTYALWCDITNSLQLFGNCAVGVSRGQPSGNPGTTMINSLYNAALLYCVVYEVLGTLGAEGNRIRENLNDHFDAFVYGDDNVMVFSQEICSILDPQLISTKMLEFGHIYTSDMKDDSQLRYRTFDDISILKRHFAYDHTLRSWFAPLELASVLEPLNWDKVDVRQEEQKRLQMSINACTAIRELSMHPPHIFNEYAAKIIGACEAFNIKLDTTCYFSQINLRRLLKGIETQNPNEIQQVPCSQHGRRNIDSERLDEQPSSSRLTPNFTQNDSTVYRK